MAAPYGSRGHALSLLDSRASGFIAFCYIHIAQHAWPHTKSLALHKGLVPLCHSPCPEPTVADLFLPSIASFALCANLGGEPCGMPPLRGILGSSGVMQTELSFCIHGSMDLGKNSFSASAYKRFLFWLRAVSNSVTCLGGAKAVSIVWSWPCQPYRPSQLFFSLS